MSKPIYGTDLSKPMSVLIEDLRNQLTQVRGQINDIGHEWSGWREHLECVEGLLTCGLISLAYVRKQAQECEVQWGADYLQKARKP